MRRIVLFALVAITSAALIPSASALSWIGQGDLTKSFSDPKNWTEWVSGVGATNRLPRVGETVYFSKGAPDLHIYDDDAALASQLTSFYLDNNCRVYWDVTTNATLYATIGGSPTAGMFYKMGKDTTLQFAMPLASEKASFPIGGAYTVAEGTVRLPHYSEASYTGTYKPSVVTLVYGYCTVSNGATIILADKDASSVLATQFYRLTSYGLVTNDMKNVTHSLQVRDGASTPANPSCVYGPIGGKIEIGGSGCLDIYSENNANPSFNPTCSSGGEQAEPTVIGLKKFGLADGTTSSMGTQKNVKYTWSGVLFKYLGTGETTDKKFDFKLHSYYTKWQKNYVPGLDGGPHGGLVYNGQFQASTDFHSHLQFTGSNAVPCVVGGSFYPWMTKDDVYMSIFVYKRGTGIWRFADGQTIWKAGSRVYQYGGLTGGCAIEEGVAQVDSMSDRHQHSGLGTMTDLYGEYYGAHDESKRVEWAISFGTDDENGEPLTEGTLESLSTNLAYASERRMVLRGDGRLKSSGAGAFRMAHVKARTAGEKTITLDGTNTLDNILSEVEDGAGTVSVVKEGSGKWILNANQTFSGDLVVKAGTLEVAAPTNRYNWYRFTDMSNTDSIGQLSEISFYDAEGRSQSVGLRLGGGFTEGGDRKWIRNEFVLLQPGQYLFGKSCWAAIYAGGNSMSRIFDGTNSNGCYTHGMQKPEAGNPVTWDSITVRLTNNAPAIVSYDICRSSTASRNTRRFRIEGSRDGLLWNMLDERTDTPTADNVSTWISDNAAFVKGELRPVSAEKGFAIADGSADEVSSLESVRSVTVAPGATLRTTYANVGAISKLTLGATGTGTIDGFRFAEEGTLDITSDAVLESGTIPLAILNSPTAANLANWSVTVNGAANPKYVFTPGASGIQVRRCGMQFICR